jgi:AAA15 family ATPase/GTPase
MIESITIKNFRCFQQTQARGFSRINLFGGRNNAGKTALLEALSLIGKPSNKSITKLLAYRKTSKKSLEEDAATVLGHFFYNQDKETDIEFEFGLTSLPNNKVTISYGKEVEDFIGLINSDKNASEEVREFAKNLENTNTDKSSLRINVFANGELLQKNILVSSSNGMVSRGLEHTFIDVHFIPANAKLESTELAKDYSNFVKNNIDNFVLEGFNIIDDSIKEVTVLITGEAMLHLRRDGGKYMPLPLFGDAMNKIADFILKVVNHQNSVLLIDEIENGIHHENQEQIWHLLFKLCEKFNVQLFATSHSHEMIEAFKNLSIKDEWQKSASYFEMSRNNSAGGIIIQKMPNSLLEDKINRGKPIRGEMLGTIKNHR